ncbi:hypothetical protein DPEC_G00322420 [Dallia pectoralis]|uniref:Uncharacterized protein n=1 Tax=Dallia pectoralis TaxID=75939 RepID=A0ACC2FAE4_DALPE|nr:hypothetical protein DPEC_G00322420 [Dallia pectoralis]
MMVRLCLRRRRAEVAMGTKLGRSAAGLEDSSIVNVSLKLIPDCFCFLLKYNFDVNLQTLPVNRLARNEMPLGRYSVAFYAELPVESRNWKDNPQTGIPLSPCPEHKGHVHLVQNRALGYTSATDLTIENGKKN